MGDALKYIFGDYRPIDLWLLVIELIVLLLIAYEVGDNWLRHRKKDKGIRKVSELMNEGMRLQRAVPASAMTPDQSTIDAWVKAVNVWLNRSHAELSKMSPSAASAFIEGIPGSSSYPGVAVGAYIAFGGLLLRIGKLRSISEKPDTYF